jgi:hypothetical protein
VVGRPAAVGRWGRGWFAWVGEWVVVRLRSAACQCRRRRCWRAAAIVAEETCGLILLGVLVFFFFVVVL